MAQAARPAARDDRRGGLARSRQRTRSLCGALGHAGRHGNQVGAARLGGGESGEDADRNAGGHFIGSPGPDAGAAWRLGRTRGHPAAARIHTCAVCVHRLGLVHRLFDDAGNHRTCRTFLDRRPRGRSNEARHTASTTSPVDSWCCRAQSSLARSGKHLDRALRSPLPPSSRRAQRCGCCNFPGRPVPKDAARAAMPAPARRGRARDCGLSTAPEGDT